MMLVSLKQPVKSRFLRLWHLSMRLMMEVVFMLEQFLTLSEVSSGQRLPSLRVRLN